jgi:hypothetical protein
MKKILAVALIGLIAAATLRGDIIPSFGGTSPGTGTNTVWNYTINITSDQEVTTGDFFTIYDFGPFISGTNTQPSNWTFSSSLVTPPPSGTNPPDNPTLANLTWTYTGSATIMGNTNLAGFSVAVATSTFQGTPSTRTGFFAAQGTRATGGTAGTKVNNVGQLPVPVPEPTTMSLLAFAGVGAALRAVRRRR